MGGRGFNQDIRKNGHKAGTGYCWHIGLLCPCGGPNTGGCAQHHCIPTGKCNKKRKKHVTNC
eukprot:8482752-Ditylum_brightwellii.AAC.1